MNNSSTVKTKADAVEKRYGKTIKGNMARKPKPKTTLKPVLKDKKIGFKVKVSF